MIRLHTIVLGIAAVCLLQCTRHEVTATSTDSTHSVTTSSTASTTTEPAAPVAAPSAPPTATAATTAAPAAGPAPIATAEGENSGIRAELTELKRLSGGTLSVKFRIVNDSAKSINTGYDYGDPGNHITDYGSVGGVVLVDPVGKKKYFVARDTENKCICSRELHDIEKGTSLSVWAKFPAPPDDVQKISVIIPHFAPMDDAPISR